MKSMPASVLVIEPHPLLRESLRAAIIKEPALKLAELGPEDGSTRLQLVIPLKPDAILLDTRPDLILLDLGDPGRDEMGNLAVLRALLPETPILALVSNEVPDQIQSALDHGAQAVLAKSSPRTDLIGKLLELHPRHSQPNSLASKGVR